MPSIRNELAKQAIMAKIASGYEFNDTEAHAALKLWPPGTTQPFVRRFGLTHQALVEMIDTRLKTSQLGKGSLPGSGSIIAAALNFDTPLPLDIKTAIVERMARIALHSDDLPLAISAATLVARLEGYMAPVKAFNANVSEGTMADLLRVLDSHKHEPGEAKVIESQS